MLKPNHKQLARQAQIAEAKRLLKGWIDPSSIRMHWRMAIGDYWFLEWSDGHVDLVKGPDTLDRLIAFFSDYKNVFHQNVFVEAKCTHPHEKCYTEWEGDRQYGYTEQHVCGECNGYILPDMIDRFRTEQHPELIREGYRPLGAREYYYDDEDEDDLGYSYMDDY